MANSNRYSLCSKRPFAKPCAQTSAFVAPYPNGTESGLSNGICCRRNLLVGQEKGVLTCLLPEKLEQVIRRTGDRR